MPDERDIQDRTITLGTLRSALGNWLAQNQIIINGEEDPATPENPNGLGTAGDIPNVGHFLKYLYENYPTKE